MQFLENKHVTKIIINNRLKIKKRPQNAAFCAVSAIQHICQQKQHIHKFHSSALELDQQSKSFDTTSSIFKNGQKTG